jgi:hypothetical protein
MVRPSGSMSSSLIDPTIETATALSALLYNRRYTFTNEIELQDQIEEVLITHKTEYSREFPLSPQDRIDFLVGSIGVEIKTASSASSVQRQLWRYAADERITALILVTSRATHRSIPADILGKPVFVVYLLHSIF